MSECSASFFSAKPQTAKGGREREGGKKGSKKEGRGDRRHSYMRRSTSFFDAAQAQDESAGGAVVGLLGRITISNDEKNEEKDKNESATAFDVVSCNAIPRRPLRLARATGAISKIPIQSTHPLTYQTVPPMY